MSFLKDEIDARVVQFTSRRDHHPLGPPLSGPVDLAEVAPQRGVELVHPGLERQLALAPSVDPERLAGRRGRSP